MAEYMRFSENAIVHKIPESLSHEDAVLIEPMACAIHTVARGIFNWMMWSYWRARGRWGCAWYRLPA